MKWYWHDKSDDFIELLTSYNEIAVKLNERWDMPVLIPSIRRDELMLIDLCILMNAEIEKLKIERDTCAWELKFFDWETWRVQILDKMKKFNLKCPNNLNIATTLNIKIDNHRSNCFDEEWKIKKTIAKMNQWFVMYGEIPEIEPIKTFKPGPFKIMSDTHNRIVEFYYRNDGRKKCNVRELLSTFSIDYFAVKHTNLNVTNFYHRSLYREQLKNETSTLHI